MNKIREILDQFIEDNGWDDETIIDLLCKYIQDNSDSARPEELFKFFLTQQVERISSGESQEIGGEG